MVVVRKKAGPPGGATIAAIKQRQAAMKAMEDAEKAAEEEARLAEEAERQAKEQAERLAKEAKDRKKQKEKEKKDRLKKEGKLLSKSEREKQERDRQRIEQLLLASKILDPTTPQSPSLPHHGNADSNSQHEEEKSKKKVVYTKQKKSAKKIDHSQSSTTPTDTNTRGLEGQMGKISLEDDVPDNWDELLSDNISDSSVTDSETDEEESIIDSNPLVPQPEKTIEPTTTNLDKGNHIKKEPILRSPICCVLGHVDTGKTKILDKIRETSVQEGEAGGITQQIGATYMPITEIEKKTACLRTTNNNLPLTLEYKVPGLLVIDTPGHESFSNLRSRGSSLCNIAVLVVDLMHGLEAQTLESLNLLRLRKTPFVVALNKIDRLYDWNSSLNAPFEVTFSKQSKHTKQEFENRLSQTKLAFAEAGLNAEIYSRNNDTKRTVSLVPTSAHTGEGIPDLLHLLIELTQTRMTEQLSYTDALECTILEVKIVDGLGTTVDVILSNGTLREGDRVVMCGLNGPIVTVIRSLLTPQPLKELRVKGTYMHHKQIRAAQGIKIVAPDLDKVVPGSKLLRIEDGQDVKDVTQSVMEDLEAVIKNVTLKGVSVQASTLGSLEALLAFLKDMAIPVSSVNIGPVHKKDILKCAVMHEQGTPEYAVMLCFDVKIDADMLAFAQEQSVKIFQADIIYHLFDQFTQFIQNYKEEKKKAITGEAIFPCMLRIVRIFNKKDPIVCGVDVVEGILKVGTPVCVMPNSPTTGELPLCIGKVTSIELNHKTVETVKKGSPSVAIKIEPMPGDPAKMGGRHFTESDSLISKLSRTSIDLLKLHFREALSPDDWNLVRKLKPMFHIS